MAGMGGSVGGEANLKGMMHHPLIYDVMFAYLSCV